MDLEVIWVKREGKYFCKWGWTSHFGKHEVICPSGGFCIAVIARSEADEAIHSCLASRWIASRSLSSGAHSRDALARNDREKDGYRFAQPILRAKCGTRCAARNCLSFSAAA